ncbi:MAG: TetR/AcrR family transcriptional regulator [Treponema sp.]
MPKFERKTKDERMQEIQRCAKEVFLAKGFRCTTMEDIVKHTSLSKGGVYQYYKSTKSILFDIMQNGNYFRYERTKSLIEQLAQTASPAEIITQVCMAKLFDEVPEKRLYLMFLSEILYDKEYEDLFFKLEHQALQLFIKSLNLPPQEEETFFSFISTKSYFIFKILNGILVMHELFSDKQPFIKNKEVIHNMIFTVIQNFFAEHQYVEEQIRKNMPTDPLKRLV